MHGAYGKRASDLFFAKHAEFFMGLEYGDVKMRPGKSDVIPKLADTRTHLTRNVPAKIPLMSAAMDNVTEAPLAIAMAKAGGIGVIHRNLTPKEQGDAVRAVKRHLNAIIENPEIVFDHWKMQQVRAYREERKLRYRKFPVVNDQREVVGWLGRDEFDFCLDNSLLVRDVMARVPKMADPNIKPEEALRLMCEHRTRILPLVTGDGKIVSMYSLSDVNRIVNEPSSTFNVDANGRLRVAAAIGVGARALEYMAELPSDVDVVVVDTAHGDAKEVRDTVGMLKRDPGVTCDVLAGNVSEGDAAERLYDAGVDGIKVGVGPGSICTTQNVSGHGRGQLTAVQDCAFRLRGLDVPVCADGGIEESGDIVKAIGAGASSVMLGSLLAGCDESPGDVVMVNGIHMKRYRGMGSASAMEKRSSRERYRQGDIEPDKAVPEGVESYVSYKGSLAQELRLLIGGLCAGMGYAGAHTIRELQEKARFERATSEGARIARPHGVMQIVESSSRQHR